MNFSFKVIFVSIVALLTMTTSVNAAQSIPYQGHLTDVGGIDLDAAVPVEVRLYDSLIAGIGQGVTNSHVIYAESHAVVNVESGVFRIAIGEGTPLDVKWSALPVDDLIASERVYLELWVGGERLSPRQRLGSLPAALHATKAKFVDELDGLPPVTADMIPNYSADRVGIGTFTSEQVPNLDASKIEGMLHESQMPNLNASAFSTSGTIASARLANSYSAAKIASGEVGLSHLPSASFLARADFVVTTGTLAHGQHLPLPDGFTAPQCSFVFSPTSTNAEVDGIDIQRAWLNAWGNLECQVCGTTDCKDSLAHCSALYMAVCKREG